VEGASTAEHYAAIGEILMTEDLRVLLGDMIQARPAGAFYQSYGFNTDLPTTTPAALTEIDLEISRVFMPEEIIAHNIRGEFRQVVNLFMRFPDITNDQLKHLKSNTE
jgi:hypothetical protein